MSGKDNSGPDNASSEFLEQLEESGFFRQIKDLEGNLRRISMDIKSLGETATQRLEETESLAAHILAIEAILAVMIKNNPLDEKELKAAIEDKTAALSKEAAGNSAVRVIAENISNGKG
ncbi:MAG: hypothetical protein A3G18_03285 [Rhodospirillales bacterium RIFCSPLOWO2_12_FULL_58_28]|nr:MAG: hypothetical protein A3H92_03230 [Rhodospirillales bacterium RIFCSPLOWO2_02_FULL_58_16]OHC77300.1 MAG: hypothetical protein A3G18_03285 [Rhodospirillales bacterium RIFCSPLOWO2_12_FULL_58_28]